jgi:hypothetical protein
MTNQTELVTFRPSKPGHFSAAVDKVELATLRRRPLDAQPSVARERSISEMTSSIACLA